MYFYDIEDYLTSRVIGCNNEDSRTAFHGDVWEDIASTARATKNATIKAFNEYYLASRAFLPSTTCDEFDSYHTEILNMSSDSRWIAFWELSENQMNGLTREIWDDYLTLNSEIMGKIKTIMSYFDNDSFEAFYP